MWVTILTPLYNGIEFLEETLSSVLQQTDKDWILLIGVNGHGESGGTVAEKARDLAKKDDRFRVIVQPPKINNKPKSLNDLVKNHVTTEWVAILDADDLWLSTKLEEQKKLITEPYGVIGTLGEYFGSKSGNIPVHSGEIKRKHLLQVNHVLNSSAILRTKYAFWNERVVNIEDYELWLRLVIRNKVRIYNIPQMLFRHRIHSSSAFNTKNTHNQVTSMLQYYRFVYG